MGDPTTQTHTAEGAALGFYYQSFYALLTLVQLTTDDAAIGFEQLDDVELKDSGRRLLYQLKHSIRSAPPSISVKSPSIWRTMKVWIDALPSLTLSETTFCLVTVGGISARSPLLTLTDPDAHRSELVAAMTAEAARVVRARDAAELAGKKLPYSDRVDGCSAFLDLSEPERTNLIRRVQIRPDSPPVEEIEQRIAAQFDIVLPKHRAKLAARLVEWWDRQVVYCLCGQRERFITRAELQSQVMTIVADLDQGRLTPEFETLDAPEDYQPDGMLARQIRLVKGKAHDLGRAIREEWRAREQRARWLASNPGMATKITDYDCVLREHWSDRHAEMVDSCADLSDDEKCASGLEVLRWTHNEAPHRVRPIAEGWTAPYYVRGSYQVLAIDREVGWHPHYEKLLGGEE